MKNLLNPRNEIVSQNQKSRSKNNLTLRKQSDDKSLNSVNAFSQLNNNLVANEIDVQIPDAYQIATLDPSEKRKLILEVKDEIKPLMY